MLKALLVIPTTGFALYAFATPEALPEIQAAMEKEVNLPSASISISPATSEKIEEVAPVTSEALPLLLKVENSDVTNNELRHENTTQSVTPNDIATGDGKESADGPSKIDPVPEVLAEFPGGDVKLWEFMRDNVKYPAEAMELGIQGRVMIQFLIKADGTISDVKPLTIAGVKGNSIKELAEACVNKYKMEAKERGESEVSAELLEGIRKGNIALLEESIRLVKSMPKWKPAQTKGNPVDSQFTIPISFRLQ